MASTTNVTSSFVGKNAIGYIAPAIFGGKTLDKQLVNIHAGVKYKLVLQTGSLTDMLASDTCDWTPSGTLTIGESVLTVTDLVAMFQQCGTDLESGWESLQMTAGALNSVVPASFQDFIVSQMQGRVAQEIEYNLWRGAFTGISTSLSSYTQFTGFLRLMDTNASVVKVTKSASTSSNVIDHLKYIFTLVPDQIREDANFTWYCSTKTLTNYRLALAAGNYVNQYDTDRGNRFMNFELIDVPGMPDDCMALGTKDNFHVGVDLLSDVSEVRIVDSRFTVNDENIRVKMRLKIGTQITNPSQLILVR